MKSDKGFRVKADKDSRVEVTATISRKGDAPFDYLLILESTELSKTGKPKRLILEFSALEADNIAEQLQSHNYVAPDQTHKKYCSQETQPFYLGHVCDGAYLRAAERIYKG